MEDEYQAPKPYDKRKYHASEPYEKRRYQAYEPYEKPRDPKEILLEENMLKWSFSPVHRVFNYSKCQYHKWMGIK